MQIASSKERLAVGLLMAILALAAGLRFYRLDAQSLWNDEGNSARLAERSLESITSGTASDIHPPLYYYVLHFWRAVFGAGELALRALSVLWGVGLVGWVYLVGDWLFDRPIALIGAGIAAIHPFQIYYSQEVRMYAMLAFWAAASTYAVLRSVHPVPQMDWRWMAVYVLTATAGLYTQYTFAFLVIGQNIIMLFNLIAQQEQRRRRLVFWIAAQAAIVILYLPWLPIALARTGGWGVEPQPYAIGPALVEVARVFAYGITLPTAEAGSGLLACGLLLGAGLILAGGWPDWYLVVWWLLPVALMFGLGLYRDAYLKFLLMSSAPVCLLMARGLVQGWRAAGRYVPFPELRGAGSPAQALQAVVGVGVVVAVLPLVQSLANLYFDPVYARDDYRGVAEWIRRIERADDAVLLIAPNQWEVFTYYYPDPARVYPLAQSRPPNPTKVAQEMAALAAKHARLFVLFWGDAEADPHKIYEAWLMQNTYKADERWWGKVRVALYAAPQAASNAQPRPLQVRLGDAITLQSWTWLAPAAAGDVLMFELNWQTAAPLLERYKVFVHVVDAAGQIVAQVDREPGADLAPTITWPVGQILVDRYAVVLPAMLAPGRYTLWVGLYDFAGQRLPITQGGAGDAVRLADFEINDAN